VAGAKSFDFGQAGVSHEAMRHREHGGGVRASAFGSSSFPEIVSSSREASCCAPALAGALFLEQKDSGHVVSARSGPSEGKCHEHIGQSPGKDACTTSGMGFRRPSDAAFNIIFAGEHCCGSRSTSFGVRIEAGDDHSKG
jgi:hypothetical protein